MFVRECEALLCRGQRKQSRAGDKKKTDDTKTILGNTLRQPQIDKKESQRLKVYFQTYLWCSFVNA